MSKSNSRRLYGLIIIALLSTGLFVALLPNWVRANVSRPLGSSQTEGNLVKCNEPLGQTVFEGSDVDSKGNVFVGCNYGIYKSVDKGRTFTLVFTIPSQSNPWTLMAGRIWCVYVDSRDYVFVSAISTNRLYRSTDGGASFVEVLNLGRAWNDGGIINMDEDELGNLYACEYGADKSARLFKSSTGGELGSWSVVRNFDTRHLHNVRMSPYNNWLYVATSEDSGLGDTESRSIFRSKDHGATWTRVVQQPTSLSGFVAMAFLDDWVVLGEDNAGGYSNIDRFRDDGSDNLFTTETVWSNPSATNFYGGTKLGDHLVFATGRESNDGTLYVLESTDAQIWNVIDSVFASSGNDDHRGILNPHPNRNGRVYTCQVVGSAAYFRSMPVVDGTITPHEYDDGMAVQLTGQWDTNWIVDAYILWDTQYMYVVVNESVPGPTTGKVSWIEVCIDAGPTRAYLDCFCLFDDGTPQYCGYPKPSGGWAWYPSPYPWSAATNSSTEFKFKYTDYGIAYGDTIKMAIDRNLGPPPPYPLGKSAYWPGHEEIVYPTPDVTSWGTVTLGNAPKPPSGHVVDGIISTHEYDSGMAVQLVGRTNSSWTVNAYVDWDPEYLYVAVNESVPSTSSHQSWIEFAIDPGPASSYLYAFVLFDDHVQGYDTYHKPAGPWGGHGTGNFSAISGVATEFKVNYTDYGIALGDTIKMSIDRNQGPPPPAPYGFAAFWPQNAQVYGGTPNQADPTTWGNVYLSPPPVGHVVDGVIGSGEYDAGIAVQLVGRTDPTWNVSAYIDWDAEYLYVAVNESVPPGTGTQSWIEFAIDAGPARPYLDGFVLFCSGDQEHAQYTKSPPGTWGWTPYAFLAATGAATEFRVNYTDFGIALGDTIKIAIDRNQGPPPPAPYGFAAFWPQNAQVYYAPPDPTTWGNLTLEPPGLEFALVDATPSKPFEYCKTFEIEAYASNISGHLSDYDFTIAYDSTLMRFVDVDCWGVLGTGHVDNTKPGTIHIWDGPGGQSYAGPRGLLFALTFHVEFNDAIGHIWRTTSPHELTAQISFTGAELSFDAGTVPMSGIIMPLPLNLVIHLIQGDVNCDGKVDILDLRALAACYDQTTPPGSQFEKYDLKNDGTINLFDLVVVANMFGYNM